MDELMVVDWAADLDTGEVLESASAISGSPTASDLADVEPGVAQ